MAIVNNAPPPLGDPIANPKRPEYRGGADPLEGLCSQRWGDWFGNVLANQERSAGRLVTVKLTDQDSAGITTTEIPAPPLTAGVYRISYYLRMSRLDSITADVQPTFRWVWDSQARQYDGASISTNTLAETGTAAILIEIDNNTVTTYETNVSMGSGDGLYALTIVLEEVDA